MYNTILVTAIGSFSALCAIKKLRQNGFRVIGCDIYPGEWHAETVFCNQFYQAPLATQKIEYIDFLKQICKREGAGMIIPLTDLEIDVVNEFRDDFTQMGITVAMPSEETLSIARNKYLLAEFFKDDDEVMTVQTIKCGCGEIPNIKLPLIAKPINGRSSEGIRRIESVNELSNVAENTNYIVQPIIEGPIITVDYVRSESTKTDFYIPRQELLRTKNGAGTTVKIFQDASLSNIVSKIGAKLHINGCVNMEFIKYGDEFYLIDINPRFSAGVAFSCLVGYDMITAHINCHLGNAIPDPIVYRSQIITKSYSEVTTKYI